jgi:molybdate transport system ATP-binding protein
MIRLTFAATLRQGHFTLEAADEGTVEVLGVFGPSGSGKTSLLEVIAGLRIPDRGRVRVENRWLLDTDAGVNVPVHHRRVGYVPQDVALFPHLDVRGNLLYGRRSGSAVPTGGAAGEPVQRHDLEQVGTTLEIAHLIDRPVCELSGGERQRVAIGRALMSAPRILLLDEPLTAVDRGRKDRILPYLLRIRRELHVPMVYVTHDAREMREIADRVLRLDSGRLVDAGAPADVLSRAVDE